MAKKRAIINVTDFSGGYSSDLPDERMPSNMVRTGLNVYWENILQKRQGISRYGETMPSQQIAYLGQTRAYMNGKWTHVIAAVLAASSSDVRFFTDNATAKTFVEIDTGFTRTVPLFTTDAIRFAIMKVEGEDAVVGVDSTGTGKPFIIYYDGGFIIKNLEEYDLRTRDDLDWYAGQYDSGAATALQYLDDTTDAQSTTADDFQLAEAGTNNDGFYVAGVVTFNKFVITSASQFDGSPVAVYEFYNAAGNWVNLDMIQTPTWTAAAGDRTFEFNIPGLEDDTAAASRWVAWDGADADDGAGTPVPGSMYGRFVIRVRFTTAPTSTQTADYLTVFHSQYLTQIMNGDIPHQIATHNSRLFLAVKSDAYYSPYGQVTGWEPYSIESFIRGGSEIQAMITHRGYLAVFKGASIYGMSGNSVDNWDIKELDSTVGSDYPSSLAVINQLIFFLGADQYIYAFNGDVSKKISKHIHSDIVTDSSASQAYAINHKGWYILSIGNNTYKFDPDTFREDDLGDGIVSFWKYSLAATPLAGYVAFNGDQDTGELIGISRDFLYVFEDGTYADDIGLGDVDIPIDVKTKDITFGAFGTKKNYSRVKPNIEKAGSWTFTLLSDHEANSTVVTLVSGTGPGQYTEDVSIPYVIDGKDLTLRFQNTSSVFAAIYGYALNVARRVF